MTPAKAIKENNPKVINFAGENGMRGRGGIVGAIGIVLLAFLGGCGGGEDESITKAEFVRQANAICKRAEAEWTNEFTAVVDKASQSGRSVSIEGQVELINDVGIPSIRRMVGQLDELEVPADDEEIVERIVTAFDKEVEAVEDDPRGAVVGKVGRFDEANELSEEYGLEGCAWI